MLTLTQSVTQWVTHSVTLITSRASCDAKYDRRGIFFFITTNFFLFRKHYFHNKLLTLWKELPRYCSWLFTLEWQRGEKEALYEGILFLFRKGKGSIRWNWKCKIRDDVNLALFLKTFFKEYWFNVNLLSKVLELDNHERNMWPISVINLKLDFFGRIYIFFVDFHSYYKAGSFIDMVILYLLLKYLFVFCIKCPLILPKILMKE